MVLIDIGDFAFLSLRLRWAGGHQDGSSFKRIENRERVVVVNYVTRGDGEDRLRLYDPSEDWKLVQSVWVSHAYKSDSLPDSDGMEGCANKFSNTPGTNTSSRGAMLTAKELNVSPNFAGEEN
jgi:hypothetical protein